MQDTSLAKHASAAAARPWNQDALVAGLVGLAHLCAHVFQMLLPPIYPWLMRDFGFGYTEAGLLATVFFISSASAQALAGFVVDRIGALRVLTLGLGLLVTAGLTLAICPSYRILLVTAACAGAGNGMFHPADFTLLNRCVSPSRLGHAFALHGLSGNLGWFVGTALMTGIAGMAGWHVAGLGAALFALVVTAVLWWRSEAFSELHSRQAAAPRAAQSPAAGQFAFLRSGTVWMCFAFFFLATGAGGVLQNFSAAMVHEVYGVALAVGTLCLSAYLLGSAAGTVVGGFVSGREARTERVVAMALSGAGVVSMLLAAASLPEWSLVPCFFLIGLCVGAAGPSRDLLVRRAATAHLGTGSFGRVYGFVYSGLDIGLALVPLMVGRLLDQGHFQWGLVCVGLLQTAAVLTALSFRSLRAH